ncbi:metallophosphoesterase family protein [Flavobacterium johnsoniae]|uniref:Metallophosphoesterase n=1 Tax=Flavobacterium johnsoniae (strain ATCC 17061 / DSM 2064 / JCM 8514 / BCRC 14874 / CCUG 350202 / NBRC 14942 / NCIMB 11054 / UW101) TaxID=376686 RepID=A5FC87_FLAJ1|nr:metallophosphoesterase [Flavobacterium johnsoniae]ABQ07181.1 metallophosphoesterase [Flavobacterium johnsoniae UW101]OXE98895.1 metallophosphatase [Flavobacterium johnsoniae UW101]WQG80980.1 metallophosphoesterase [Flavobacterium johnsoniae UW101]SHL27953.1 Calcineurin-like phosphoesterase [Flavobacterium johnsoniae]
MNLKLTSRLILLFIIFSNYTISAQNQKNLEGVQVAFLSDVHLQDLFGTFSDNDFKGVLNTKTGKYALIRTMASQLHSTRIFNENYFAFIAALEDIAKRKIKYVALPGDYTDDGQPIHVRGLKKILDQYQKKYGIEFFITTGNHDPVGPFAQESGKEDFLGKEGKSQPIFSKDGMYKPNMNIEQPVVITADIAKMGYFGITADLQNFGFYPNKKSKFWSTPFAGYNSQNYNYKKAVEASQLNKRVYNVAPGFEVPDVSYVVEPIDGLWLMAIDGNVYIPKKTDSDPKDSKSYSEASTGYNNVLSNKKHLIKWVQDISAEARLRGKTLVAFSHFPMIDFNDDASAEIKELLGPNKWQLNRVPVEEVAQVFADAGLKIHFGGHMHINDTGTRTTEKGNTLVNIQTPSLAAYIPAYKLLTIKKDNLVDIQTITIDEVKGFDELFDLYKMEYQFLQSQNTKDIWNIDILKTKNYHDFTDFHLKELVRLRFLSDDWPSAFKDFILNVSANDLLVLANIQSDKDFDFILKNKSQFQKEWNEAEIKSEQILVQNNLKKENFNWTGNDLLIDFYRFRSADELALADVGEKRVAAYKVVSKLYLENSKEEVSKPLQKQMKLFLIIFNKFMQEVPADHFTVDLKSGEIKSLK